ncbi:tyrosine-type recombinase/integrase [Ancylobacter polymorphus]|uniref:Site-specific integrase n=1 Tax=Ancylobacter polymorphus TaxID=223390 RepID=A0A9E7A0R1_9HYPH|nr:tyrosine-type recombinase/integrase [Ancylobacter polymorphus]UOK73827.1 site-specific integrase [Ancylobacter polymorphus]
MRTYSLVSPKLWRPFDSWPHRPCIDVLIASMQEHHYSPKCIYLTVRIAGYFVEWLGAQQGQAGELDYTAVDRYVAHRAGAGELRNGERKALKRLRGILLDAGIIAAPLPSEDPRERLLEQFRADLQRRGYREKSIASYLWFCRPFLQEVWDAEVGLTRITRASVLAYVEHRASDRSTTTATIMCSRLRIFLRFLHADDHVDEDLADCIPSARHVRLAALPSFMSPDQLTCVLAHCSRASVAGRRDYAILLLLARLGLRANEVAMLTLDDIDWRSGVLRIEGKGGRKDSMPLPHEVGAAIADYIQHGRPASAARAVFHRVDAPCVPFASATPVILVARRALKRAGVTGLGRRHSHIFRHTLATSMIRSGASLTEIGEVLRHQEPDTTRIYAKVDVDSLRRLSLPWPGGAR